MPPGHLPPDTEKGDCHRPVCGADGVVEKRENPEDADDDRQACTLDRCVDGATRHDPAPTGTWCGEGASCTFTNGCAKLRGMATRENRACVWFEDGRATCWGSNADSIPRIHQRWIAPALVPIDQPVRAMAVSGIHECAIVEGGTVRCRMHRRPYFPPRQDREADSISMPDFKVVPAISNAKQVVLSGSNACVLTQRSEVFCWRPGEPSPPSLRLKTGSTFTAIALDSDVCGITEAGRVECDDTSGPDHTGRGLGKLARQWSEVSSLALDRSFACALHKGGTVSCLGYFQYSLGGATLHPRYKTVSYTKPVRAMLPSATAIALRHNVLHAVVGDTLVALSLKHAHSDDQVLDKSEEESASGWAGTETLNANDAGVCGLTRAGKLRCNASNYQGLMGLPIEDEPPADNRFVPRF